MALKLCEEKHWRCAYILRTRTGSKLRCRNHKDGHEQKDHQFIFQSATADADRSDSVPFQPAFEVDFDGAPDGSLIHEGSFHSSVDPEKIFTSLRAKIQEGLNGEFEYKNPNYRSYFSDMAISSGVTKVVSNRTCLVCLSHYPAYILPCKGDRGNKGDVQHTICEICVERFSTVDQNTTEVFSLARCPLGCQFSASPWKMRRKPLPAGVRILTLDG